MFEHVVCDGVSVFRVGVEDEFERGLVVCLHECFADCGIVRAEALVSERVEKLCFSVRNFGNVAHNNRELVCGVRAKAYWCC